MKISTGNLGVGNELKRSILGDREGYAMDRMISYCGLVCTECPAYVATIRDDDEERQRVAELWSKQYGGDFGVSDINCDGCLSEGSRVFSYCNRCEIRKCGRERKVENCAHCDDYACEKLSEFLSKVPMARETLEEERKSR